MPATCAGTLAASRTRIAASIASRRIRPSEADCDKRSSAGSNRASPSDSAARNRGELHVEIRVVEQVFQRRDRARTLALDQLRDPSDRRGGRAPEAFVARRRVQPRRRARVRAHRQVRRVRATAPASTVAFQSSLRLPRQDVERARVARFPSASSAAARTKYEGSLCATGMSASAASALRKFPSAAAAARRTFGWACAERGAQQFARPRRARRADRRAASARTPQNGSPANALSMRRGRVRDPLAPTLDAARMRATGSGSPRSTCAATHRRRACT